MYKLAEKEGTALQPHQQRVIDKLYMDNSPHGVIAYHSMGSGKTFTALKAAEKMLELRPSQRVLFIVPASLVENVYKEMEKHGLDNLRKKIDVLSYERAANRVNELMMQHYSLVVFDEAHRMRNVDTKRVSSLKHVMNSADKVLLLTGTAGYNHPSDVTSMINLVAPEEKLPVTHKDFELQYINNETWRLRNKDKLQKVLNRYVDRYETPTNNENFPTVSRTVIPVEMSKPQASMYKMVERSIPSEFRRKMQKNLPMSLHDATALNMFSTGVRQVSDSMAHHDITETYATSPKIQLATHRMIEAANGNPGFRGLAYSNYIDAGINPYAAALRDAGIEPLVYTGSLSQREKKQLVDEYNSKTKKPKVMLISSSGGEGLDLQRTRLMQVLEPHFNTSKIRQAEARAIRYQSHNDLPLAQRHVDVEEYHSRLPKTRFQKIFGLDANTAIDDYLYGLANRKQEIVDEMNGLIKNSSVFDNAYYNYIGFEKTAAGAVKSLNKIKKHIFNTTRLGIQEGKVGVPSTTTPKQVMNDVLTGYKDITDVSVLDAMGVPLAKRNKKYVLDSLSEVSPKTRAIIDSDIASARSLERVTPSNTASLYDLNDRINIRGNKDIQDRFMSEILTGKPLTRNSTLYYEYPPFLNKLEEMF